MSKETPEKQIERGYRVKRRKGISFVQKYINGKWENTGNQFTSKLVANTSMESMEYFEKNPV